MRGDDNITGQGDIRPGPGRDAIDGANDRHGQRFQLAHQRVIALLQRLTQIRGLCAGRDGAIRQILARRKPLPRPRDQQATRPVLRRLHLFQGVAQLLVHGGVEAVQLVGAVQGQGGDAHLDLEQDGLVHGYLPWETGGVPREKPQYAAAMGIAKASGCFNVNARNPKTLRLDAGIDCLLSKLIHFIYFYKMTVSDIFMPSNTFLPSNSRNFCDQVIKY